MKLSRTLAVLLSLSAMPLASVAERRSNSSHPSAQSKLGSRGTVSATQGVLGAIPPATTLHLRLQTEVSSFGSKVDTPVQMVLIQPILLNGQIVLPLGSEVRGFISKVRRIGLGFGRETALIDFQLNEIRVPGGPWRLGSIRITAVDNARETVNANGEIHGIRATATASKVLSGIAISVASLDPMSLLFGLSASLSAFRIPESEIILPTGAELQAQTQSSIGVDTAFPEPPGITSTQQAAEQLEEFARQLPYRTETASKHQPSDITSIMFLGDQGDILRALDAAGWSRSDALGASSNYSVMRSVVEDQGYKEGPVSTLLLAGKTPIGAWSKTLDTFFARHHLRVFSEGRDFGGKPVFLISATHDSGIGINKSVKTLIHLIDENIDEERGKVVDDMLLTGCVRGVQYIDRPWIAGDLKNATGDTLHTDRRTAVISLNQCLNAKRADQPDPELNQVRAKAIAPERIARDGFLYLRDDLSRGNIVYQGYHAGKTGLTFLRNRKNPEALDATQPKVITVVGEPYTVVSRPKVTFLPKKGQLRDPGTEAPSFHLPGELQSYKTRLQYSISGGYSWFGNRDFSTQPLSFFDNGETVGTVNYVQRLHTGFSISLNATINSWRYVSNEFGYNYNSAPLTLAIVDTGTNPVATSTLVDGGQVRQFTYNTLLHLRPNGSRFRPYIAAGPSFQLLRLTSSSPTKNQLLSVTVRDAALIVAAYNFGHTPPLEGGGIFQFGLQYGAGYKYQLTPRFFLRGDFRETISSQPDYWFKSYGNLSNYLTPPISASFGKEHLGGLLRQRVATTGIGISF